MLAQFGGCARKFKICLFFGFESRIFLGFLHIQRKFTELLFVLCVQGYTNSCNSLHRLYVNLPGLRQWNKWKMGGGGGVHAHAVKWRKIWATTKNPLGRVVKIPLRIHVISIIHEQLNMNPNCSVDDFRYQLTLLWKRLSSSKYPVQKRISIPIKWKCFCSQHN